MISRCRGSNSCDRASTHSGKFLLLNGNDDRAEVITCDEDFEIQARCNLAQNPQS